MKHKLSYYFSNEFYEKIKNENNKKIKEIITQYDNLYNSYESISFDSKQYENVDKNDIKNVKTFIVLFIIISWTILIYFLLKSFEIEINNFLYFLCAFIISMLFIISIIIELKRDTKTNIKSIELNKDDLKLIFYDNQEKTYNIKDISLTTKIIYSENKSNRKDYHLIIQKKKSKKEKYSINILNAEHEFYAFIIYLKSLILNIDTKSLVNENNEYFNTLLRNISNGNKGLNKGVDKKTFLISGIILSLLSFYIFITIATNCYRILTYDKVTANITGYNKVSRYNNDGERIQYTQIEIKYEYNNETYFDNIITDYTIFHRIIKKKTIYVDQNSPQNYTYFHYGNLIFCLITTYISYLLIKKYKNSNQLN